MLLKELENQGIVTLGRGKIISKNEINETPGDYPVYSSSAQGDGIFGRYGKYMFDDERITWSIDGGGRLFYREQHKYSVTNVCGWMKVNKPELLDTKYLYYCLIAQWKRKTFDYTYKAHPSVIREIYQIEIIPLDQQKKIVEILSKNEELLKPLNSKMSLLNELVKARFVEMFGDINDTTRFDRKQWNELVTIVNGKDHKKVSGLGNYGVYGTGGRMLDCTEYMVDKNTIIMGRKGTIDRPYICPEKAWIVDTAFGVNPKDERVNYMYLYWYTKNIDYNKLNKAAVLPSTTKSDLLQLWMNVPPIELQNEFAQFVEQIDKSKFVLPNIFLV